MSKDPNSSTEQLDASTVQQVAKLAKLSFDEAQANATAHGLNKILHMMDALQQFDTDGVEPLKNPFDDHQPLRKDIVTEYDKRQDYQQVAPATQDGLYLVPRVVE
ncbi:MULTISPECIES: Asp-tRNA(Asn)/Glu-tRNA(Gln) amidotransferase subunit GatC [unclassified Acinetobacter]|uniref:Asp-tRNA(Asn)/Glu-tRNA(Gln) amidotransferase subunit GatC n=1 Tax=unclassified Acinetobacter TaxID=196816 RepID=UPI0035B7D41B